VQLKKIYRPEIDGLRALAVLSVILFHAGIQSFKGGFVGVDIFFVISGYLITTIILRDIKENKFSLSYFYQRRARRILPALIVVVALSLPFAVFFLPPSDLKDYSKSITSSLTFWSNFQFSAENGYFDLPGEYKPLLHTWSLSIEEQFYIFYPLFLILIFKIRKNSLNLVLGIVFFISLFFAQWSGNLISIYPYIEKNLLFYSQSSFSEFMMPFGRIWELALGAICALTLNEKGHYFEYNKKKELFFNVTSFFGFILIIFSFFYLSRNFPYPSFYTLIPTLGTAILILFCKENTIVNKILSNKFLVFLGLISYSAYLFHYPIFSFIKYTNVTIKVYDYIYIIPLILFISFLNWKFVEKPFRKSGASVKKLIIFISTSYLLLILVSIFFYTSNGLDKRNKFMVTESVLNSFVYNEIGKKCVDINYIHEEKNYEKICKIGNIKNNKIDFIVLGDSHIINYYGLINNLAKKNNKLGLFLGYSGCPPILNIYPVRSDQRERNCNKLNKLILNIANQKKVKNLILISKWVYYTDGNNFNKNINFLNLDPTQVYDRQLSKKAFKNGLSDTLETYEKNNKNIFLIEQAPMQLESAKKIYFRSLHKNNKKYNYNLINNSLNLHDHNTLQNYVKNIFIEFESKYNNLNLIKIDDIFCNKDLKKCLIGNHENSFYIDDNHLSIEGVELIHNKISKIFNSF
jgi:peptidoglycan/LPS O-acetylase OafA/YrhL